MALRGSPELRARLKALKVAFKPLGKSWAEDTRDAARRRVPKRTGKTAASFRVKNASQRKATVVGSFVANFIDAGTKAHDITPGIDRSIGHQFKALKFQANGRTIFSKKVHKPRTPAHPFKHASAIEGLRKNPMAAAVVNSWNDAAR